MRPPKLIKPYVVTFARQVVSSAEVSAFYVWSSPAKGAPQNECFSVVDACVAKNGGRRVIGWAIWERPKVYIEAEFHAVWQMPSGEILDISPRPLPIPRILFIDDRNRKHTGFQVDNIRKPLVKDKDVHEFLALRSEYFRLTNEGDKKHQFGEIVATPAIIANMERGAALEQKIIKRYGALVPESLARPNGLPLVNHSSEV